MGKPLPPYQKYNPNLTPGIDVFFATVTFRYSHSELSDFYQIQDEYGDAIVELPLQDILELSLLENFGIASLLRSMSLQRQEDVDIYYSDATRNIKSPEPNTYDFIAFDALRSRDRGMNFCVCVCKCICVFVYLYIVYNIYMHIMHINFF